MNSQHKNHLTQLLLIKSIKHLSQQARLFSKCNGVYNRSQRWHSSGLKYMFNMVLHLQLLHSSKYSFNTGASVCSQRLLQMQGAVCQFRVRTHWEKPIHTKLQDKTQYRSADQRTSNNGTTDGKTGKWNAYVTVTQSWFKVDFLLHEALPSEAADENKKSLQH